MPPNVLTPWGDSSSLRDQKLHPGPGTPPGEVAENQRRRIFAAMVASVDQRGYAGTRISDLAEISGVSSKSFYALFSDKNACFLETLDALLEGAVRLALADEGGQGWEARMRGAFSRFATIIATQPAAAKLCLIEGFAAGPEAVRRLDAARERAETITHARLRESPERAAVPKQIISAVIGGIIEVARMLLLRDAPGELVGHEGEILDVLLGYRPPAKPLRMGERPPAPKSEVFEARDHAERAIVALEALAAERGLAKTTMEQVARQASMSEKTLYANFAGRDELVRAAIDHAGAQITAAVVPAFRRHKVWAKGVRAGFGALFSLLGSRPDMARFVFVEAYGGGAEVLQARRESLAPVMSLLTMRPDRAGETPTLAVEMIWGGLLTLCRRQLAESGPASLPGLAPVATYIALAPVLGAEEATAAANGRLLRRVRRAETREALTGVSSDELSMGVLDAIRNGPATARRIARSAGYPLGAVRSRLEEMVALHQIDRVEGREIEGTEPVYAAPLALLDSDEWAKLDLPTRLAVSKDILERLSHDVDRALEANTFDARTDRHLSLAPLWLDEAGWRELGDVFDLTLDSCLRVQEQAAQRMRVSGEQPKNTRAALLLFPVPEQGVSE